MTLDLGSSALDVVFALSFVFFLLSTIVTAVTEGISWAMKQRARKLEQGVKALLERELGNEVMNHPLVKADITKPGKGLLDRLRAWRRKPSYVSARNFALALIDELENEGGGAKGTRAERMQALKEGVNKAEARSPDLAKQLHALLAAANDEMSCFRESLEKWFDDAMDRVSGWYKRWTQLIACGVAIAVAIGLNADAFRITESLANDPAVRAAVITQAEATIKKREEAKANAGKEGATGPAEPGNTGGGEGAGGASGKAVEKGTKELEAAGQEAAGAVTGLKALKLPIFWNSLTDQIGVSTVFGWIITALAISLGAPFWFDALGKLARLRTAGSKPEEKKATQA